MMPPLTVVTSVINIIVLVLIGVILINILSSVLADIVTKSFGKGDKQAQLRFSEALHPCGSSEIVAVLCGMGIVDVMRLCVCYNDDYTSSRTYVKVLLGKKTEEDLLAVSTKLMSQLRKEAVSTDSYTPYVRSIFVAGHGYLTPNKFKPHPCTPRGQYRKPLK